MNNCPKGRKADLGVNAGTVFEMQHGSPLNSYHYLTLLFLTVLSVFNAHAEEPHPTARTTVLCYMNGDNDLSSEVLHAIDMMETAGSSDRVNVVALADGHPDWLGNYGEEWQHARLIRVTRDDVMGEIHSPVLEEWHEADLGSPATLRRFVETAIRRFPADNYIFLMFAHGRGIINTKQFSGPVQGPSIALQPMQVQPRHALG